jgi:outer membrane protein OmpA-like peptidoglycan-associated protein
MSRAKLIIAFILVLGFSLVVEQVHAQRGRKELTTKSKKAKKAFEGALTFFQAKQYADAQDYITKALKYDSMFVEAYILQGQMAQEQKQIDKAIMSYRKAASVNPDFYPKIYYMLATMEQKEGYYAAALEHYKLYAVRPDADPSLRRVIERGVDMCQFGAEQMENPVPFDPQNLGDKINSDFDEYINNISVDDQMIVITQKFFYRSAKTGKRASKSTEDLMYSRRGSDGQWQGLKGMVAFNTNDNEGALSISPDGRLGVFAAWNRHDDTQGYDLYYARKQGVRWSSPINMGENVNSRWWDSNPSISSDGKTIYFVSSRKGGYGKSDIWKVTLQKDGTWGNPVNLGKEVNTSGDELTPYIHPDGKTLYFASDGHIGMGGSDLFVTRMDDKGNWSYPKNLGYPINTLDNEMGIVLNAMGNLAYISADRKGGYGGFDVYSFELYPEARPTAVTYMRGIVRDMETKNPLKASFELVNLETQKLILKSNSDAIKGDFMVVIPVGTKLSLTVERNGYLFYSENFFVEKGVYTSLKPFLKNVDLSPIKAGESIVLKNIFFASKSYNLEPESEVELNKLYTLLSHNANLRIEIGGHTDNIGDDNANMILSKNRAKAVMDYLIEKGISKDRLSYKGYGETKPIASNDTDEGRAQNRRTEVKVIGI